MKNSLRMSDVTKISLNNQIILMRPAVKRAKLILITRLLRSARKLQSPAKTPNLNAETASVNAKLVSKVSEKHARKKEKLLKEIREIKKLALDEISKFALVNDKPLSESLQGSSEVSERERALAKLANHKFVKDTVASFRKKFPSWKVQIHSIYSMWSFKKKFSQMMDVMADATNSPNFVPLGIVDRTKEVIEMEDVEEIDSTPPVMFAAKKKQKKNKKKKNENKTNVEKNAVISKMNRPNVICETTGEMEVTMDPIINDTIISAETILNYTNDDVVCVDDVKKPIPVSSIGLAKINKAVGNTKYVTGNVIDCKKIISTSSEMPSKPETVKSCQIKTSAKSKSTVKKNALADQVVVEKDETMGRHSEMVVKRLNLGAFDDGEFFIGGNVGLKDDDDVDEVAHRVKHSSFFINSDGESGSDSEDDHSVKSHCLQPTGKFDPNAPKPPNRAQRRAHLREKGMKQFGKKMDRFPNKPDRFFNKPKRFNSAPSNYPALPDIVKPVVEEKLHPSWEAKRKITEQSKNIVAFQGSKITFNDDD